MPSKFDWSSFPYFNSTFVQLSSLKLCLALCKIFSKSKIILVENIFEKRKYFQVLTISFIESTAISWKRFDKTSSCMATLALFWKKKKHKHKAPIENAHKYHAYKKNEIFLSP